MSLPVVIDGNLVPKKSTLQGGRWVSEFSDPVVFSFGVKSSGDASPYVTLSLSWGDGNSDYLSEPFPVSQLRQFNHVYGAEGDYTVVVTAVNAAGEVSVPLTCPVRVMARRPQSQPVFRYRGLALPVRSIGEGVALVEDAYPPEETGLAVDAAQGDMTIVVRGDGNEFEGSASVVVVEQPGKLVSSSRVVSRDRNVISLDRPLKADYDYGLATITLTKRELRRGKGSTFTAPPDWFFPSEADRVLLRASLSLLLSVAPYERPMRNTLGSRLYEIPFDPLDIFTAEKLKAEVGRVIRIYEPRLALLEMKIDSSPADHAMKMFLTLVEADDFSGVPFIFDFNLVTASNS